jgi:hypothetical protein
MYIPFRALIEAPPMRSVTTSFSEQTISCQSGANVAMTRESPDGTYYTYFPFGLLTEAPQ